MKNCTVRISVVLCLGLGLTWALLGSLGGGLRTVQAQGPDTYSVYYVAVGGNCGGAVPCYDSVQAAVDAVDDPADVIKVAAGTYTGVQGRTAPGDYGHPPASGIITQVVYISKTLAVQGGYTIANWAVPDPDAYPTTLDAQGQGRVLFVTGDISPTIEGLRLTGGDATGLGGQAVGTSDSGGGVYVNRATATLRDNVIVGNAAPGLDASGGGLFLWSSDSVVSDNTFSHNAAHYGGGLYVEQGKATIEHNTVFDNAAINGGGMSVFISHSTLRHNDVFSNAADWEGGGLYLSQDSSTLSGNEVTANTAGSGGGVYLVLCNSVLEGNQVLSNTVGAAGGGMYLETSDVTLINNVVADNQASVAGSGLYILRSSPQLLHTTIARNGGGDGSGIYVTDQSAVYSSPALTNTIVASQTVGIYVNSGNTAWLESTLWYGNGAHWSGTVNRSNDRVGDPAFVDARAGDYHLRSSSAAIDGGVDAGIAIDIDGEPRPAGTGYDLGADELAGVSRIHVDVRVASSSDDAEESAGGSVGLTSSDLELVYDVGGNQTVGIRFDGLPITPGVTIANAYVQFKVDEPTSEATSVLIEGQAADDAPTFVSPSGDISSRSRTAASASWSPPPWTTIGQEDLDQRTPDLSAVVQEIVDRPGWASGNALALIITGSGKRVAESYDGDPAGAPLLHVEYLAAPPSTCWVRISHDATDYTSVQAAVDAAGEGDVVKVAGYCADVEGRAVPLGYPSPPAGSVISQVVSISKTITLQGGYTRTNWSVPDPVANPTTLDAQGQGRVICITGDVSPTVTGLRLTGGDASGLGGAWSGDAGGGAYVLGAAAVVSDNHILSNSAFFGGGLYLNDSPATLVNNVVHSNTAYRYGSGEGGGLYLFQSAATAQDNAFTHNHANSGGGLFVYESAAVIEGNTIAENTVTYSGGGLYATTGAATISGNTIVSNAAEFDGGGGTLAGDGAVLDGNTIAGNNATNGGGLYMDSGDIVLSGNTIENNTADQGGGLYLRMSNATVQGNTILSNTALTYRGGGLYVTYESYDGPPLIRANDILSNSAASDGGGLYMYRSDARLEGNLFAGNTTAERGGGLYVDDSSAILDGNTVAANAADQDGGGLFLHDGSETLINNVVVDNHAGGVGSGLMVWGSWSQLLHNTIARNTGGEGSGVHVTESPWLHSTATLTNTVLVSHTTGIVVTADNTAWLESTLWGSGAWANGTDWDGAGTVLTGTLNLWDNPAFVDPDGGDYHVGSASAVRDAGVDAGVSHDIDDQFRPMKWGFDIGADEVAGTGLLVSKQPSTLYPTAGQPVTYTIVLTSTGVENAAGVVLTDTLDGWQRPLAVESSLGGCAIVDGSWAGEVVCTPGTVVTGSTVVVTLTAEISPAAPQWQEAVNTVLVVADDASAGAQSTVYAQEGCWARINDDPTEYASVQAAVDAASPGDLIKVAGYCVGAGERSGMYQQVYLDKSLTVRGGYAPDDWSTSDPQANPTTLDARGQGRVFHITGAISPTIEGLRITGGRCWWWPGGGGAFLQGSWATISGTTVISNQNGGVYLDWSHATLRDNVISDNEDRGVSLSSSDATLEGNTIAGNSSSGVYLESSPATLIENTVISNSSSGIHVSSSSAMLRDNVILSNSSSGIYVWSSSATLKGNAILSNTATHGGGVHILYPGSTTLDGNTILHNVASNRGGGVYIEESSATLTNNVIADNRADGSGSALYVFASSPDLRHNTIARNSGGDGSAIYVHGGGWFGAPSTVDLDNTILVSHTVGVTVTAPNAALLEGTLWGSGAWANGADWGGSGTVTTGTVNVWGDPAFVDPDAGDYHVRLESDALEAGVDVGVTVDLDGEPRPSGDGYDIGADEFQLTLARAVAPGDAPAVSFGDLGATVDCSAGPGGTVTVTLHILDHPSPPSGVGTMSGYWDVVSDFEGPYTCDLTFGYDEDDLNGAAEGDIAGTARWDDGNARWQYLGGTVDTGANTVTIEDVTAFSAWLLLTSTPPQAVADLAGARSGSDLQLSWSAVTQDIRGNAVTPDHYVVYRRANEPYFVPGAGDIIAMPSTPSFIDPGILGDPEDNYYYVVTAMGGDDAESAFSNRLGAFDFGLTPAAQAGERAYNLIALNLKLPGVSDADALAAYVGDGAYMVLRHDAATQGIEWRLPGLAGTNFSVEVGVPYFLYLDDTAPSLVSLVGGVPSKDEVSFALTHADPGGSCAYNFVSVPLHRDDLADADALAADIGGVYTLSRYNAATQDLTWRMPGGAGENFAVRVGYPYIACLDETAPPMWP